MLLFYISVGDTSTLEQLKTPEVYARVLFRHSEYTVQRYNIFGWITIYQDLYVYISLHLTLETY